MSEITPPPLCCEWNFAEEGEGDSEGFSILFKYFIYSRALEGENGLAAYKVFVFCCSLLLYEKIFCFVINKRKSLYIYK